MLDKVLYGVKNILLYSIILLVFFLLAIPVLNISCCIVAIVLFLGTSVALYYKSIILNLGLISMGLAYLISYEIYFFLYNYIFNNLVFICIGIALIICIVSYFFIFDSDKIQRPQKELFRERKHDLKQLIKFINKSNINILGIESFWGTGKTLLVDHFMYSEQDKYSFIRIDTIALNLDDVIEHLILQIYAELKKQYIFSQKARSFTSYINTFKYGSLLTDLIGCELSYSSELEEFRSSISKLKKPLIIIFEDLDRIDDKEVLRKIFYISERLTTNLQGKLKIIYQYSAEELDKKGFDNYYLQKYIPKIISLTRIRFMSLFDYIIASNPENYTLVLEYRSLVENIINPITNWYGYAENIIDSYEKEKYLEATYNIRNIESFISLLAFYINELSCEISENNNFGKVLVQTCYIKCFLQKFYQTISTNLSISSNFRIKFNDELYSIWEIIDEINRLLMSNSKEDIQQIKIARSLFMPANNPINLEMFLAFCILELYLYDMGTESIAKPTSRLMIKSNYNSSPSELNQDLSIRLNRLERYFYYCIASGNKAQAPHVAFVKQFIEHVLDTNMPLKVFKEFMDQEFIQGGFEDICFSGIDTWAAIFKSFYYAAFNWNESVTNKHFDKLIILFFDLHRQKDSLDAFDEYFFRNLNSFLSAVQNYNLKKPFFSMLRELNKLRIDKGFCGNEYFSVFQQRVITILVKLQYTNINISDLLEDDSFSSYEKYKSNGCNIYTEILYWNNFFKQELWNYSKFYEFSQYLKQFEIIESFINKLIQLNEIKALDNYQDEHDNNTSDYENRLSDEALAQNIKDNSISPILLFNELRKRNKNHKV